MADLYQIICAYCLWSWLGPPLMVLWYIKYFRVCGWHHIIIPWGQWARIKHDNAFWWSSLGGSTSWTSLTSVGQVYRDVAMGVKSATCDCLVFIMIVVILFAICIIAKLFQLFFINWMWPTVKCWMGGNLKSMNYTYFI